MPRCGSGRENPELLAGAERLLALGGLNGRKPLFAGCCDTLPLAGSVERLLLLGGVKERNPPCCARVVPRAGSGDRFGLFGALNGRKPPRFWFETVEPWFIEPWFIEPWFIELRLPILFVSRFAGMPALGRCMVPRAAKAALERPPAGIAPTWLCCMACRRFDVCCVNDAGRTMLLCVPKKRCGPPLRTVEGAAARPLADRLARVGTTGKLPAIMRAPRNCSGRAPTGRTPAVPKRPAFTVERARPICVSRTFARFE